jgi:hypothetical protein
MLLVKLVVPHPHFKYQPGCVIQFGILLCCSNWNCSLFPVTSSNSILTVNQDIDITTQPVAQTICEGPDVNFNVAAIGTISSYVWRKNGVPVSGGNYSGNNSSNLIITGSIPSNSGTYDVIISSPSGSCPQVISNPVALLVKPRPTATPNPSSQTACSGIAINTIG